MARCVEIEWSITPFRSDKFIELWKPYAELVTDYGASGYALLRSTEDSLIVRQLAYFDSKDDWNRYWNSDKLIEARQKASGYYVVPVIYHWHEVVTEGRVAS